MIKFGTSGWRGIIGEDFTFENVRVATQGVANYLKKSRQQGSGVIVASMEFARFIKSFVYFQRITSARGTLANPAASNAAAKAALDAVVPVGYAPMSRIALCG